MKSSVTVSLIEEARGGPFIFWNGLADACEKAERMGYDAVEVFAPGAEALRASDLRSLLQRHNLSLSALGTGGGWLKHRLTLTNPDRAIRERGCDFIKGMIDSAAEFGAAVIIGSMQGRWEGAVTREQALGWLAESLHGLREHADKTKVTILYEFLNRYETNLINRVEDAVGFLRANQLEGVKVLADLFHMNIEENSIGGAIRAGKGWIGHVHFVDSNRRAAGLGHIDFREVIQALREIGYEGYLSAEALPYPNPDAAAEQTIKTFKTITIPA